MNTVKLTVMMKRALAASASMIVLAGCGTGASPAGENTQSTDTETSASPTESSNGVNAKEIGEPGGWGCPSGDTLTDCVVTFKVTNIERVECEFPEIHTLQEGHYLIRVDLDIATTQSLADDESNQLSTLFLNQWSAKTADGYTVNTLNEKNGCISGIDDPQFLLPDTKTRPTAIIEIPNDTTDLQIRPFGMQDGGGWSWSIEGVA